MDPSDALGIVKRDGADLRQRTIDPGRVAGVTPVTTDDGVRALIARTLNGMQCTFIIDRALDPSELVFRGFPLTWYGPGIAAPVPTLDPDIDGFERTFFGGLMTTCGLDAFGPPGHDRWGTWPQHGHVNRLRAESVRWRVRWEETEPDICIDATIRQVRLFGEALRLERSWRIGLYDNRVTLVDLVTNDGGRSEPHMLLYHCNIGYPMLGERTGWSASVSSTVPRDAEAARGLDVWNRGGPPDADFREQVFIHQAEADDAGWATIRAYNPDLAGGVSLSIGFRPEQLPALFTWRMLGYGAYVMAAEPANCRSIAGRIAAEHDGILPMLEPGATREYSLRFDASSVTEAG